jgi:hypothetical protein
MQMFLRNQKSAVDCVLGGMSGDQEGPSQLEGFESDVTGTTGVKPTGITSRLLDLLFLLFVQIMVYI